MRNFILLTAACFTFSQTNGQNISYSKETISKDGTPYAKLVKGGNALLREYSLQNMAGEELAVVKPDTRGTMDANDDRYIIHFLESGNKAVMDMDLGFAKQLAKEIVKSDLVTDGKINPKGEKRFIQLHPYPENNATTTSAGNNAQPAERDRAQNIHLQGQEIIQGTATIGRYTSKEGTNAGKVYTTYSIFLPDGTLAAEGMVELNSTSGTFTTLKDNKQHSLRFSSTFKWDVAKELAKFLSERYYM